MKKTGIAILILGIFFIGTSSYIQNSVEKGKVQVSSAQKDVDQGNSLLSLTPITENIGKELSKPFQHKIDNGKTKIQKYESLALWLKVGGAICFVVGIGILFVRKKK